MTHIQSTEELKTFAKELARTLTPLETGAKLITLSGDLGAGKTALAQALAAELGVTEQVTSPTFVIERGYELQPEKARGFNRLIHIDAYRLKDAHEIMRLGWDDMVHNPQNLILVEWPERIAPAIPATAKKITLSYVDETTRHVSYDQQKP